MRGAFISLTIYASRRKETSPLLVSKNRSRGTYCVVDDHPVTWLIRICCPSLRCGAGVSVSSTLVDTKDMLEPESMTIEAVGPLVELIRTVAFEGCAPRKVVPGGRPLTGLSSITSEWRDFTLVDPNPFDPRAVTDNLFVSSRGNWDMGINKICAIAQSGVMEYNLLEWL